MLTHAIFTVLVVSVFINAVLVVLHVRDHQRSQRYSLAYRHLRFRLQKLLDEWAMKDYCGHCKQWGNTHHFVDCPQMTVRFAMTKAEQHERA